ncbi:hypothetical protein CFIMG_007851RA00001 [Ceratocystis fimbriata CBS 114723]|uniref:Uncharacterized protein n=1 Tax=Ceratocystis fimbriata CBS 114723 TaxID=1035309 RepID=A0A2C5WUF8_9PEZI|nr:hypothetical protein CFIMG_007851RA00001 [Ceratocystis fimbriata CBS 114723]
MRKHKSRQNQMINTPLAAVSYPHGYSISDIQDDTYWILSETFDGPGAVVKISVDMEHKSVTILDNYLGQDMFREERLTISRIFQGLCHIKNIPCSEMEWVVMDIDDPITHLDVKDFRDINDLGPDKEIEVADNQPGWGIFSSASFYKHATQMLPGLEAKKIIIKQERRDSENPKYAAVIAEVMAVSFKQPGLKDEDPVVSPADARDSELSARKI